MINTNVAFANAIAELPVIGQLAEYVKFDKSLSKAIENKYLQEVNLVSWDNKNNIRLLLPYVIADEKKLILFFQLPEEFEQQPNQWINIFLKEMKNSVTGKRLMDTAIHLVVYQKKIEMKTLVSLSRTITLKKVNYQNHLI